MALLRALLLVGLLPATPLTTTRQCAGPWSCTPGAGRPGRTTLRFEVRPGDDPIRCKCGERAELATQTGEREGVESWWRFATMFPSQFTFDANYHNTFVQWHSDAPTGKPNLAFEVTPALPAKEAAATINVRTAAGVPVAKNEWREDRVLVPFTRNRWFDFRVHVKWSAGPGGLVEVWVDGVQRARIVGPNLYAGHGVYAKQGLYRGHTERTSVVLEEELRRGR